MTYASASLRGLPSVEHDCLIENTSIGELQGEEKSLFSLFNNSVYINVLDVVNKWML